MEFLQAISSWNGESCLLNEVSEKAFLNHQDSVAQVLRAKGLYGCNNHRSPVEILMSAWVPFDSWKAMVHPLEAHRLPSRRYNQPNRYRVHRHPNWMQYASHRTSLSTPSIDIILL